TKGALPAGNEMSSGTATINAAGYFTGWTREIMPFSEVDALANLYDPSIVITSTTDPGAKLFRESEVPMYTCPSDLPMGLGQPAAGPGSALQFMSASYKGNAGRGDGFVTWYLLEDLPEKGRGKGTGCI